MRTSVHYQIFTSPVGFQFNQMTPAQARQYFEHFVGQMPIRIMMLETEVCRMPGFEDWSADASDRSIAGLCIWLKERAKPRELSAREREMLRETIKGPLGDVLSNSYVDISEATYSFCIDAGMYLGEIVRRRHPEVIWQIGPKPKRGLYYNRPVIATPDKLFMADPFFAVSGRVLNYVQEGRDFDLLGRLQSMEAEVKGRH